MDEILKICCEGDEANDKRELERKKTQKNYWR